MTNKKWTNEEIENLVNLYNSGKNTSELAKMFECSAYIIRTRLKEKGITLRKYSNNRIYKSKAVVKLSTWESKIGTSEFDYFIGVLATDGCIINTCIALEVKDLELINNYHTFLNKSCNINSRVSKVNGNTYYNIKYKNKEIVEFLSNYGIIPKKSNILELPYINWNILLGIFDGDGSIVIDKRYDCCFKFSITSGSIKFINQIKDFLESEGILSSIYEYNTDSGHWYNIIVCKGEDIYKIYNNLYKDSSFFLTRKKEKFCPLLKKFNNSNSVNSVKEMENSKTEPSPIREGAETRNGEPKDK